MYVKLTNLSVDVQRAITVELCNHQCVNVVWTVTALGARACAFRGAFPVPGCALQNTFRVLWLSVPINPINLVKHNQSIQAQSAQSGPTVRPTQAQSDPTNTLIAPSQPLLRLFLNKSFLRVTCGCALLYQYVGLVVTIRFTVS